MGNVFDVNLSVNLVNYNKETKMKFTVINLNPSCGCSIMIQCT